MPKSGRDGEKGEKRRTVGGKMQGRGKTEAEEERNGAATRLELDAGENLQGWAERRWGRSKEVDGKRKAKHTHVLRGRERKKSEETRERDAGTVRRREGEAKTQERGENARRGQKRRTGERALQKNGKRRAHAPAADPSLPSRGPSTSSGRQTHARRRAGHGIPAGKNRQLQESGRDKTKGTNRQPSCRLDRQTVPR